jgi:hypothetical protein
MTWRIQLPQPHLRRVDLLSGEKTVVAAWTQVDRVQFYDQRNGGSLGERVIEKLASTDRQSERWRTFLASLTAPNSMFLPFVRLAGMQLYVTDDGRIRLYQMSDGALMMEVSGKEAPLSLDDDARVLALDLDRGLGLVALLDSTAKLHLYQQRIRIGSYETGLQLTGDTSPIVVTPQGGKVIYITDGQQLCAFDTAGKPQKRLELHYPLGLMAASPDSKWLIVSDAETGVLRVYRADDLQVTHQRYAIDLAADARRMNTAAGAPPTTHVPNALAINNRGIIAFGLGGLLCVTSMTKMRAVPVSV